MGKNAGMLTSKRQTETDAEPGTDEHAQVMCASLDTNAGQHNGGADPDGLATSEIIGKVRGEWVCGE